MPRSFVFYTKRKRRMQSWCWWSPAKGSAETRRPQGAAGPQETKLASAVCCGGKSHCGCRCRRRRFIVSFEEAYVSHGGEGALYLRLRRRSRRSTPSRRGAPLLTLTTRKPAKTQELVKVLGDTRFR